MKKKEPCPYCGKKYTVGPGLGRHKSACKDKQQFQGDIKMKETSVRESDWLLWNRGEWRGWAVGFVSHITPEITRLKTSHLHDLIWNRTELERDVKAGRVFFVDPPLITRMILTQLEKAYFHNLDVGLDSQYESAIVALEKAIDKLEILKETAKMIDEKISAVKP